MRKFNIHLIVALMLFFIAGCKTQYEMLLSSSDEEAKYAAAWQLFDNGKYRKAAAMFESLSLLTSGTARDDTVRYYWALSNYRYEDYVTAEANFTSYLDSYPRSSFSSEARFLKLDCMYRSTYRYELDQNPTRMAIVAISEYIVEYPNSDRVQTCRRMLDELNCRLDTKEFEAARLYYKMEDYIAARTSFKNILKDNADNLYREQILYYIAKSAYKYAYLSVPAKQKERYMEFEDEYLNFIGELPDSQYRKDLDGLYDRCQKFLRGDSVMDKAALKKEKKDDRKTERELNKK